MLNDRQRHIRKAMKTWPALAAQLGQDPNGWSSAVLSARKDPTTFRTVLRVSRGNQSFVLKHEDRAARSAAFAAEINAHATAARSFPAQDGFSIPALIAFDEGQRAALFEDAGAETIASQMESATFDSQMAFLEQAGGWLDVYHRAARIERRPFRPRANLKYLRTLLQQVNRGQGKILAADEFRKAGEACIACADRYERMETVATQSHGDFHLKNVLVGDGVWVVDFMPDKFGPVGHDISRILLHYAALFAPQDRIPKGEVVPAEALAAFFRGYRLVDATDPSVGLLMRVRVLTDWSRLTGARKVLNLPGARRLAGLRALAKIAFAT